MMLCFYEQAIEPQCRHSERAIRAKNPEGA